MVLLQAHPHLAAGEVSQVFELIKKLRGRKICAFRCIDMECVRNLELCGRYPDKLRKPCLKILFHMGEKRSFRHGPEIISGFLRKLRVHEASHIHKAFSGSLHIRVGVIKRHVRNDNLHSALRAGDTAPGWHDAADTLKCGKGRFSLFKVGKQFRLFHHLRSKAGTAVLVQDRIGKLSADGLGNVFGIHFLFIAFSHDAQNYHLIRQGHHDKKEAERHVSQYGENHAKNKNSDQHKGSRPVLFKFLLHSLQTFFHCSTFLSDIASVYLYAIASISRGAPFGRAATCTQALAGAMPGKNSA